MICSALTGRTTKRLDFQAFFIFMTDLWPVCNARKVIFRA